MTSVLVACDTSSTGLSQEGFDEILELHRHGVQQNLRCTIGVLRDRLPAELPDRVADLLLIAAYAYAADTRVTRGTQKDVFGERWRRSFSMVIPVADADFWRKPGVQGQLSSTLEFLTGDDWAFEFATRTAREPIQMHMELDGPDDDATRPDSIVCFSGGMDSLAALLAERRSGRLPVLVSHRPAPVIETRQKNVSTAVRAADGGWRFPHFGIWVNRMGGRRSTEFSQRSRSFLFASLAIAVAGAYQIRRIVLADNGVVSINLPQSAQNVGTFLSRSTHPKYLRMLESLGQVVLNDSALQVENSLLFKTRREVAEAIAESDPRLIAETVSCAHVEGQTRAQPHCGVCSQCIDRRFATRAAGLEGYDLPSAYETDIMVDALDEGEDLTHVENYVRFALRLERLDTPDALFSEFAELFDYLPLDGTEAAWAQDCWELFERHQRTVNGTLDALLAERAPEVRQGRVAADTLLGMVLDRQAAVDPSDRYEARLGALLAEGLPPSFRTVAAKNEAHVQDVGQSVLVAAKAALSRELPMLPFAGIGIKPDFADQLDSGWLYLEFKYPKDRSRLNAVITEMTSRVTVYRSQNARVMFVVYDPARTILDDAAFKSDFERHEGVSVVISR